MSFPSSETKQRGSIIAAKPMRKMKRETDVKKKKSSKAIVQVDCSRMSMDLTALQRD